MSEPAAPLRVVLADDNPIVRMGLSALLGTDPGLEVVGEAGDGATALEVVRRERPDVLLLDVRMPGTDGLSVLPQLADLTAVLMLTHTDEPQVISQALSRGAVGYLVHGDFDSEDLVSAVHDVAARRIRLSAEVATTLAQAALARTEPEPATEAASRAAEEPPALDGLFWQQLRARYALSPRELEICQELVKGLTNAEIGEALYIEAKTVKNHLNNVFAKLQVSSRAQALAVLLGTAPADPATQPAGPGARRFPGLTRGPRTLNDGRRAP